MSKAGKNSSPALAPGLGVGLRHPRPHDGPGLRNSANPYITIPRLRAIRMAPDTPAPVPIHLAARVRPG